LASVKPQQLEAEKTDKRDLDPKAALISHPSPHLRRRPRRATAR
jgi:hypothetical protein